MSMPVLHCVLKIFSMDKYKKYIEAELLSRRAVDHSRLLQLSMISLCFDANTFDDLDTPCWISIINFCALDLLGKPLGQLLSCVPEPARLLLAVFYHIPTVLAY